MRQIMRSSLDCAGFAQLCARSPIMRTHNRIIQRSLVYSHMEVVFFHCLLVIFWSEVCSKITVLVPVIRADYWLHLGNKKNIID